MVGGGGLGPTMAVQWHHVLRPCLAETTCWPSRLTLILILILILSLSLSLALTLTHLAEDHMLAVEVRRGHRRDEELGLPCGGRPR